MTSLKFKEIQKMNEQDRKRKLKELKLELVKSKSSASKTKSSKTKEIKKIIARIKQVSMNTNKINTSSKKQKEVLKNK